MARILTFNHKIINPGNNRYFGSFGSGPTPPEPPEPTVYDVILTTDGHGSITANPMSGAKDTLITLSNTPDQNYVFSKYTLNNVDLAGNTFLMPEADANVKGWFEADMRTITVTQPSHGTITAPASAQVGSTVTLSCTPDTGYVLQYFTLNGVQIQGNTFVMPASNVTVSASIAETDYIQIGNQKWSKTDTTMNDGLGGITVQNGRTLYTLEAAQRIANKISGWHIPSKAECDTLLANVGSNDENRFLALASETGWQYVNGRNTYRFSALPQDDNRSYALYWTSTKSGISFWWRMDLSYNVSHGDTYITATTDYYSKNSTYQLRLVKD